MSVAEFLMEQVQSKGWVAIGNLYFDNAYTVFPFTAEGRVCYSKDAAMFFTTSKFDTTNTQAMEWNLVAHDDKYTALIQTIACIGEEHLQHFDMNLFSLPRLYPSGAKEFQIPTYPNPSTIDGMTKDPETGLYADTDTIHFEDDREISYIDLYPQLKDLKDYTGIQVDGYKRFNENHKVFCIAMNKLFGVSDCI